MGSRHFVLVDAGFNDLDAPGKCTVVTTISVPLAAEGRSETRANGGNRRRRAVM